MLAIGSIRGAPGATTLALALASVSNASDRLVVEADPSGGVLAARFALGLEPGLVSLASVRRDLEHSEVLAHTQLLDGGVRVLCGPAYPDHARCALTLGADRLAPRLQRLPGEVFVDLGRVDGIDSTSPFIAAATRVLLVVRPDLETLQGLAHRVAALAAPSGPLVDVVVVGQRPYRCVDVAALLGSSVVVHELPFDGRTADALNARRAMSPLTLRRAPLIRGVARLLESLTASSRVEASA